MVVFVSKVKEIQRMRILSCMSIFLILDSICKCVCVCVCVYIYIPFFFFFFFKV